MKKLLGILVLSLLWCNVGVANGIEKVTNIVCSFVQNPSEKSHIKIEGVTATERTYLGLKIKYLSVSHKEDQVTYLGTARGATNQQRAWLLYMSESDRRGKLIITEDKKYIYHYNCKYE